LELRGQEGRRENAVVVGRRARAASVRRES
jgi:hypothetical protein